MGRLVHIRSLLALGLVAFGLAAPSAVAQSGGPCGLLLPSCEEPPPPAPPPSSPAPPPVFVAPVPPGAAPIDPQGVDPLAPNPLEGLEFFVEKHWSPAHQRMRTYRRAGKRYKASLLQTVALRPQFRWFGRWNASPEREVSRFIARVKVEHRGSVPQIAVLRHQGKACHDNYLAGGPAEDARTRRWYDGLTRGIGTKRVVIGFEPDSLGTVRCLAKHRRRARLDTLRYGVDVLSKLPNATVYIEAGASDWEPSWLMAKKLRYVGVAKVRGFMLNVTHFDWTANNISFGRELSRRLGGKHFVINTSQNGRGPVHYRRWLNRRHGAFRRINVWCHPLKRGMGPAPTTRTAAPEVLDAYLYIGRPGLSDGACNGGPLPIGSWFEKRGLMFAKYATEWLRPPAGTRNGHYGDQPPKAFAGDQYQPERPARQD